MIKDYLAKHPQTDDGLDHIGISMCAADWHWMITLGNPSAFIAEGSPDTGEWLIDENNQAIFKYRSPKVKEYFRWLSRMYDEGILDPEFATQTQEDYIAKIGAGRVIGLTDNSWNYGQGETILKADGKVDLTYAGLPVTMDEDTKCASLMYQGLTVGWGIAISKDCEDPVAAIKFIDYMCSDEGMVLRHWGIEGVNYEIDEEGHRYRTEEEINYASTDQDYAEDTGVGFHVTGFPNAVIVINAGAPVEMGRWEKRAKAILWHWYAGMEGGTALAEVLLGKTNPSGKLPESFPYTHMDCSAHCIGTFGKKDEVHYKEGIFVGYRYYEKYGIPV